MTENDPYDGNADHVQYPEGASPEVAIEWFDGIVFAWMINPEIYTSCGLLKAIRKLSEHEWEFILTLFPDEVPDGVPTVQRKLPNDSGVVHDIGAKGIGCANRENPYFIGVSQDYLTLSYHRRGLIKAFAPDEIIGLRVVPPVS